MGVGLQQLASVQPEEQEKPRAYEQDGSNEHNDDADERAMGRGAVGKRQSSAGQECGVLGYPPTPYHRHDAEDRERAQSPRPAERQE